MLVVGTVVVGGGFCDELEGVMYPHGTRLAGVTADFFNDPMLLRVWRHDLGRILRLIGVYMLLLLVWLRGKYVSVWRSRQYFSMMTRAGWEWGESDGVRMAEMVGVLIFVI